MADPSRVAPAHRLVLAATAATTFGLALVVGITLLPYGSLNRDESTYVEFADLIRTGHLTLPAETHRPFRPWASAIIGDRFVMKYTPPWPSVLAVFGTFGAGARRLAPALAGAVAVLLVHALGRRLGGRRATAGAIAGAAAFALSPLVVVQSATFLSYVFQLDLGLAAAVLLLRGSRRAAVAAGVVAGVAAFARPFDAILLVGSFAAVVLWRRRDLIVPFVVGGLPVGLMSLVYDAALIGGPFRLPFTVTGSADGYGFGRRGVFPGATVRFDALDGIVAAVTNGGWLLAWAFGGPLLLALAVVGYRKLPPSDTRRALVVLAVVHPLGYLAFWGSYAVVHFWRGAATLGPFYHLPMLVPLAVLGGHGLVSLPRRFVVATAVAATAVTAAWLPPKVRANQEATDVYAAAHRSVAAIDATQPTILIAADRGVTGYDSWTPFLHNRPDLAQPVLYADERAERDLELVARYPDRRLLRLVPTPTTHDPKAFRVEAVDLLRGEGVDVTVRITAPAGTRSVQPYLVEGRHEVVQEATPDGRVTWSIAASSLAHDRGVVAAGVEVLGSDGRRRRFEQRLPYRRIGTTVELLAPGRGWRRAGRRWVAADVRSVVRIDQGT